jgi:hypothetical protein
MADEQKFSTNFCDLKVVAEMLAEKLKATFTEPTEVTVSHYGGSGWSNKGEAIIDMRRNVAADAKGRTCYTVKQVNITKTSGGGISVGFGKTFSKVASIEELVQKLYVAVGERRFDYEMSSEIRNQRHSHFMQDAQCVVRDALASITKDYTLSIGDNYNVIIGTPKLQYSGVHVSLSTGKDGKVFASTKGIMNYSSHFTRKLTMAELEAEVAILKTAIDFVKTTLAEEVRKRGMEFVVEPEVA